MKKQPKTKEWLSSAEMAQMMGVTQGYITRFLRAGLIQGGQKIARNWAAPYEGFLKFMSDYENKEL
jgi:hypothetical protein